ncbi:MAG: hypothetical protein M1819_002615 [Sarea resinae]|nr:MAG: hypothetical protein M1819_002615 [Sarea resinae]
MSQLFSRLGLSITHAGTIANTLPAHVTIQHYQTLYGGEVAGRLVDELYTLYFSSAHHPSSRSTLLTAARAAHLPAPDAETEAYITRITDNDANNNDNDKSREKRAVGDTIKTQRMDGVDSVPYVVIEGRRRDFSLVGAKEVDEYVKVLEQVVAESGA